MDAKAILEKLASDAQEAAAATLADATGRAAQLRAESDARIAAGREKILAQAEQDAAAAVERMRRMADLEERKRVLADKRVVISQAFDAALQQMNAMPAGKARAFLMRVAVETADGDEALIPGAEHAGWLDDAFIRDVNAALVKAGKPGQLTLGTPARAGCAGFVLVKGETEVDCTYAALIEAQRLALEPEVASVLFPADDSRAVS